MDCSSFKIDTHVHILPDRRLQGLARWIKKAFPIHPVSEKVTARDMVNDLKEGGLTHFFNLVFPIREEETDGLNAFNVAFCKNTPGAIPFGSVHQDTPQKAKVAERLLAKKEVAGFKLHPFIQKFDILDPRMEKLYAFLQEAQSPLLFHTGFDKFYKASMPIKDLRIFLDRYPNLPVVFIHMAFPLIEECFELLADYPQLYVDATGVFGFIRESFKPNIPPRLANGAFERIMEMHLPRYRERIFFGSDHPVGWGALNKVFGDLTDIPVFDDVREWISYRSAMAFVDKYYPGFDWSQNLQKN